MINLNIQDEGIISYSKYINNDELPTYEVVPNWIYDLARIARTEIALYAIAIKPPKSVRLTHADRRVVLRYSYMANDSMGLYEKNRTYEISYYENIELFFVDKGNSKLTYIAFKHNKQWFATYLYSYAI